MSSIIVEFNGEYFYRHPFINNYLASKNGNIYSLKSKKILSKNRNNGNGYLTFNFYNKEKKNIKIITTIVLFLKYLMVKFLPILKLIITTLLNLTIKLKTYNFLLINKILKKVTTNQ